MSNQEELPLAKLIGALSYALDITEAQPPGHCVRCCLIGMRLGRAIGLTEEALWELYYTLLLKDVGCSADIFDAITAARPYRAAIPLERALPMMRETVGTQLDAECFAALESVVSTIEFEKNSLPPHAA
jgi:HD-GYP domain-containing protein (c-di-GMP phosphodiesterase class II)